MVYDFWVWLKAHDLPNWLTFLFSLIVWPLVLFWWSIRKRQGIPHFEVLPIQGQTHIGGQRFDAVDLIFTNRTGRVVYLSHARLRECRQRISIPPAAVRDISGGWRELKFERPNTGLLLEQECILQSNASARTNIAVSQQMAPAFYSYRPGWARRLFRRPKYFLLQYTAMVGEKRYFVQTVY